MPYGLKGVAARLGVSARFFAAVAIVLMVGGVLLGGCSGSERKAGEGENEPADGSGPIGGQAWRAAWSTALFDYGEPRFNGAEPPVERFEDVTLRQLAYVSAGGEQVRVLLSNLFGKEPLVIERAHLAVSVGGVNTAVDTDVALTFSNRSQLTIPAGAEVWSDPAEFAVEPHTTLAVSLYLQEPAPPSTYHDLGWQHNYVIAGDAVSDPAPARYDGTMSYFYLGEIDVLGAAQGTIVAFGDSITEGANSTIGANNRYPDYLARRLAAAPGLAEMSVVNAGISGNRVLHDRVGPRALDRFERDVLARSGVSHVIIALGINDIGFGQVGLEAVSAEQIIGGLRTLVERAVAAGVEPFIGTLAPFGGAQPYYSAEGEAARQEVNAWIRNQRLARVIDFDAALRDPQAPQQLRTSFDSGDGIHPNDAGYEAMAQVIDLELFR